MLKIKLCKTNKEFLELYQDIINTHVIEMNLFVKNLNPNIELQENLIRGAVYHNDKVVLLFLNAYPFNFLVHDLIYDEKAISLIAKYVVDNNILIRGINARKEVCDCFIKETGYNMEETLAMDIMVIEETKDLEKNGQLVLANDDDINLFKNSRIDFFKETMNLTLSEEDSLKLTKQDLENQTLYKYINEDNEVVSFLKFNELYPKYGVISLVYTLINHRNKKYGKMMMHDIVSNKIKNYPKILLFVDKNNPISNKVYSDIGFKILIDNYDYRIIY